MPFSRKPTACLTKPAGPLLNASRGRRASDFSNQRRKEFLFGNTSRLQRSPFRAGRSIRASFDFRVDGDVRAVAVDRLNLNGYRVTAASPTARGRGGDIGVAAQFSLSYHRALNEGIRLADNYSLGRFRSRFVDDQFSILHHFRDCVKYYVAPRGDSIRIWYRRHFRCASFAEVDASAGAGVGLDAVAAVCAAVANAFAGFVDAFALRPYRSSAKQNYQG